MRYLGPWDGRSTWLARSRATNLVLWEPPDYKIAANRRKIRWPATMFSWSAYILGHGPLGDGRCDQQLALSSFLLESPSQLLSKVSFRPGFAIAYLPLGPFHFPATAIVSLNKLVRLVEVGDLHIYRIPQELLSARPAPASRCFDQPTS